MSTRLHPQSAQELRNLIQLHGLEAIVAAAGEIAQELERPARCQSQINDGPHVWTCKAAAGHIGEHRHNDRTWGDTPAEQPTARCWRCGHALTAGDRTIGNCGDCKAPIKPARCGDVLTWGSGATAVCLEPAGHDGAHHNGQRRWN